MFLLALLSVAPVQDPIQPTPPVATRREHEIAWHGDVRDDPYFWLRDRESADVVAYLEAENAYATAVLAPTEALQQTIYDEIVERLVETDLDVPTRRGAHWYYTRTEEGNQYRIYCRRGPAIDGPEEVLLDLNELGAEHAFVGLGAFEVSDDGQRLAYSIDLTGFRQYELRFKDLSTGAAIGFTAPRVTSVAWAADGATVFFTQEDEVTKRSHLLFRQRLDDEAPAPLYDEKDERFRVFVQRTRSRAFLTLTSASHTTSEIRVLPAERPRGEWQLIEPRRQDHEYYLDHRGDAWLIRTNDAGRNFRLATAPVATPGSDHWRTLVPHSEEIMLTGVAAFADFYVLAERQDALPRLSVHRDEGAPTNIPTPETVYSLSLATNPEFDTDRIRVHYQSMVTPSSVYDYHLESGDLELLKRTEVEGGYDPARYVVERVWVTARDGARVPVSLVAAADLPDGPRPTHLVGYGSYGFPYPVSFSHARVSLLDRGVVCAIAHIRGGGELGKQWHDQGRMAHKMNTFYDFIDVAEHLIESGRTTAQQLAIEGGSAGGLLMGAVANLRPELFGCVVSHVPFVDVLTTMLDEDLPLTVGEFEEWGNPKVEAEYLSIRRYCPYSNLRAQDYPAMLVRTSFHDSQVMYWEPAKYVAKLRTLKTDDNPLLFLTNLEAGHGGSSGRYDRFKEIALDYAFVLWRLGLPVSE